jgi:hypothetical protein
LKFVGGLVLQLGACAARKRARREGSRYVATHFI